MRKLINLVPMAKKNEEQLVVDIVNNTLKDNDRNNPLFYVAKSLAGEIKRDFKKINRCEYIGNTFAERGDLIIYCPKKEYIELKFITSSKSGKGTLANTSQNILSEYNLVNDVIGWLEWRKKNNYEEKALAILNDGIEYTNFQTEEIFNTEKVLDQNSEIEIKARILRAKIKKFAADQKIIFKSLPSFIKKMEDDNSYYSLANSDVRKAINSCKTVIELARNDLQGYLRYCRKKDINRAQFLKFIVLLKSGFHTTPLINANISLSLERAKELVNNYRIYYYYTPRDEGDRIKKELPKKIKEYFPDNIKDLKIIFDKEGIWIFNKDVKIMYLKFHWRNVFFGISTPSVEIFDRLINHI